MGSPPKGREQQGGWESYTRAASLPQAANLHSCEMDPSSLWQAAARFPVPAAPNLGGRRTVWPLASDFWPRAQLIGQGRCLHTPTVNPVVTWCGWEAECPRHAGAGLRLPRQKLMCAGVAWPQGNILRAVSSAAGTQNGRGDLATCCLPGLSSPCLAKGASAGGRGAVRRFPAHALHPWGLA